MFSLSLHPESTSFLLPLAMFAFVSSVTPGPNNVMLTASGAAFGYRRSVPHMLGICLGVVVMVLLIGAGLGKLFEAQPQIYTLLKYAGAAYLIWLAWKIAGASGVDRGQSGHQPFSFWQAAAFQWVNPKAWVMAIGAITTYTPSQGYIANVFIIALVFAIINLPSVCVWAGCGSALRSVLTRPRWLLAFNLTMAMLLVVSLYPILFDVH